MAFTETTLLSTREPVFGDRRLGQVVPVPGGRIDKVSVYLEPKISDAVAAAAIEVVVEIYMVDGSNLPTGSALASDSVALSGITTRGLRNFRLETDTPSLVAVVLRTIGGTSDNHVAWRYVSTPSSGEELLTSENDGATWTQDSGRKFAYIAYSLLADVIDADDQSAIIQAGEALSSTDDTEEEFELAELTRAATDGDTVVVSFGDFVVTLVVDQSGSMTWNDNEGLRFDFLKAYIDDLEANAPATSDITYSLVRFGSRKVGALDLFVQTEDSGTFVEGVRIVRKTGSPPTGPTDGLVVFEGFATQFRDTQLTSGTLYHYGVFSFDNEGNFSSGRTDSAIPQSPPDAPIGVAALALEEIITLSGDDDIGKRQVKATWVHPQGADYDEVTLVRRTDRFPESPTDGDVILAAEPLATTTYTDFPSEDAVVGLTYYYAIFGEASGTGLKVRSPNARRASITISEVDRVWERAEAPFDTPPVGFDDTPPGAPTGFAATVGKGQLLLSWSAADVDTKRFRLYYKNDEFPRQETTENGASDYDGELVFDGEATSFLHTGLENGQPHFYALVALDQVANQSDAVTLRAFPDSEATAAIPPSPIENLSVDVFNATTVELTWDLALFRTRAVEAYFGDTIRVTANLSFEDNDPRRTSGTLEFIEESRTVDLFDVDGNPAEDDAGAIDAEGILTFDEAPATQATSISGDIFMAPFTNLLNPIATTEMKFHASVNVKKRSTGATITEIITDTVTITFKNPFELSIQNDPLQTIPTRTFLQACDSDAFPEYAFGVAPGVFVRTGEGYSALVEAKFRGLPLDDELDLQVRILDAETNLPSDRMRLPSTNDSGVSVFSVQEQEDEVLDRTGEPTGETVTRSTIRVDLPPQDLPGQFVLEVRGSFEGYSRIVRAPVTYAPSLHIDVKPRAFFPDGVNSAEQEAFVYLGAFDLPDEDKIPVPDLTVTDWEITKIAGGGPPTRSFFSTDSVPGTGVKSYARGGIARNVFFGPGTDVEPPSVLTCTDGELYVVKASANAFGMSAEGFGVIELLPFEPIDLKRIFLRLSKDQVDEFGAPFETTKLAATSIFADGSQEAAFEVVARPEEDAETGSRSGTAFRDLVVNSGGLVPSLKDGTIVNIIVAAAGSTDGNPQDVVVKTDLSPSGAKGRAKATVINGLAKFTLSANVRVSGPILDTPLETEVSNPFYGPEILFDPSPLVFSVAAYTTLEISGRPAIFAGGGGSLGSDVPPAFLSLIEPLQIQSPKES